MLNCGMRAYGFTRYGGPDTEAFLDLPVPEPGPGELLVRVAAAGVNPADWKVRSGLRRAELPLEPPVALGREVAGVVERLGSGVAGFAAGDEVFGGTAGSAGGWAELARVPAIFAAHRPAEVAATDAAVLPVAAATAYDALAQLALPPGATLLVIGAGGGVGLAAVQLACARGVEVVGIAARASTDCSRGSVRRRSRPGRACPSSWTRCSTSSAAIRSATRSPGSTRCRQPSCPRRPTRRSRHSAGARSSAFAPASSSRRSRGWSPRGS